MRPSPNAGGGSGEQSHTSRGLERDRQVVEQCIEGVSLMTIGQQQGFVSPGPTVRLVDRALETALPQLDARAQRRLDGARLDRLLAAWWKSATGGDADLGAAGAGHPRPALAPARRRRSRPAAGRLNFAALDLSARLSAVDSQRAASTASRHSRARVGQAATARLAWASRRGGMGVGSMIG